MSKGMTAPQRRGVMAEVLENGDIRITLPDGRTAVVYRDTSAWESIVHEYLRLTIG